MAEPPHTPGNAITKALSAKRTQGKDMKFLQYTSAFQRRSSGLRVEYASQFYVCVLLTGLLLNVMLFHSIGLQPFWVNALLWAEMAVIAWLCACCVWDRSSPLGRVHPLVLLILWAAGASFYWAGALLEPVLEALMLVGFIAVRLMVAISIVIWPLPRH